MERRRLAGSPKRKIYKRDNTAIKSVCQAEMCGKMHLSMAFSCLRWRRESGQGGIAGSPSSVRLYVVTSLLVVSVGGNMERRRPRRLPKTKHLQA